MGLSKSFSSILFVFLFVGLSSSAFLSDDVFGSHAATGRNLLQAKKACPVNFEFQNYTIITSQCKGPDYPANSCCNAFKEFACPFADEINDLTTDCASTMFSYINLHGKYPPGLFAAECREDKEGLPCPALPPSMSVKANMGAVTGNPSMLLMVTSSFLVLLFQLLKVT
ncbi:GPI-anchored protein LLG1-like [Mangifera indica]|uniref:GPI-anchored protein LLG1-like n=1 Tax=Mangifera indica TaxID=29780 RepID=UPI001CF9959A|nr:GPI-anchored protein LLG1-like [Mangifera indica]